MNDVEKLVQQLREIRVESAQLLRDNQTFLTRLPDDETHAGLRETVLRMIDEETMRNAKVVAMIQEIMKGERR